MFRKRVVYLQEISLASPEKVTPLYSTINDMYDLVASEVTFLRGFVRNFSLLVPPSNSVGGGK